MKQNIEYEMSHWTSVMREPHKLFIRYKDMVDTYNTDEYFKPEHTIVDLGCGAAGGIFSMRTYAKMIGVDTLWNEYISRFGWCGVPNLKYSTATFETFDLTQKADGIICVNALDHSGDIVKAATNIRSQLKPGGAFILGVHMRTREQLNAGHRTVLTEKDIDNAFCTLKVLKKRITKTHGKHPAEYKGWFQR